MTTLKYAEISKMERKDLEKKLDEMKIELAKAQANKTNGSKVRDIKKIIARIHTFENSPEDKLVQVKKK